MTVLPYLIVILLGQFALTLGMCLLGVPISLLLFWVPDKLGVPLRTFLAGCAGGIVAIGFGFFVFEWLVGTGSFGLFPFLATAAPLSIPLMNDYRVYQELKRIASDAPDRVRAFAASDTIGRGTGVLGEVISVLIGGYFFTSW